GDGAGIMAVELRGGGGDDSFELIGLSVGATVAGEGGLDSLFGEAANSEWFINGLDAGSIGMATFSGIENLLGAADNEDRFSFAAEGSISGYIDGGAGGFDTLHLAGGTFD